MDSVNLGDSIKNLLSLVQSGFETTGGPGFCTSSCFFGVLGAQPGVAFKLENKYLRPSYSFLSLCCQHKQGLSLYVLRGAVFLE